MFVFVATAGADAAADKQARWVVMKEDRRLAAKAAELVGRASLRREDNMITNNNEGRESYLLLRDYVTVSTTYLPLASLAS